MFFYKMKQNKFGLIWFDFEENKSEQWNELELYIYQIRHDTKSLICQ